MWKFYTSAVLLLLCVSLGDSFFPGFPFPQGMDFPGGLWSLPNRILRPPSSRPRPRPPRPDGRERCPSEGIKLISHPTDCEMYILCVDGEELTKLTCPDGLHFSRITRSCTDPRAAGCEDIGWECPEEHDPANVVFLPNQEDCSRYYLCWAGTPIPMSCAPGLHWSIFENACMDPNEAACMFSLMPAEKITPAIDSLKVEVEASAYTEKGVSYGQCPPTGVESIPNPENCETYFLCVNGARFDRECPAGLHFSPNLRRCADPDVAQCELGCPSTGLAFLPHEDDCNLYYICFNGMRTLMSCPNDLHWSTEANRCMNPDEAGCEVGEGCPATGIEQIPDPEDCERFILCINGFEIPLSCGPGLHFSPTQRACMSPEEAECEEPNQWKCPEVDTPGVIVFIPNQEDCSMYYLCWQGNQIPLRCGAGLHWSITENRCLPPDQAECPWDDDIEKCPEEGIIAISHPVSCEKYILCVNGHEVERDCPFGLHFSRELRNCAHPLIANCIQPANYAMPSNDATCPTLNSSKDIAFMPNKDDCGSYFLCYNDDSKLFNCAKGLQFDMNLRKCMKKNKAHCVIQS